MTELEKLKELISILVSDHDVSSDLKSEKGFYRENIYKYFKYIGFLNENNASDDDISLYKKDYSNLNKTIVEMKKMVSNPKEFILSINEKWHIDGSFNNFKILKNSVDIRRAVEMHISEYGVKFDSESIGYTIQRTVDEWRNFIYQLDVDINTQQHFRNINELVDELTVLDEITPIYQQFVETFEKVDKLYDAYESVKNKVNIVDVINGQPIPDDVLEVIEPLRIELNDYINDPENLFNNEKFNKNIFETYAQFGVDKIADSICNEMNEIYKKVLNCDKAKPLTQAERFFKSCKTESDNPVSLLLSQKSNADELKFQLDLDGSFKYKNIFYFNDGSLAFKDKNNQLTVPYNNKEAVPVIIQAFNHLIDSKLRKSPFIAKFFKSELKKRPADVVFCLSAIDTYVNNEAILKSYKFNVIAEHGNFDFPDFEGTDDTMNAIVKNHHHKQYAHSIVSNKYKHLYNDDSYKIIAEIKDLSIEASVLQDLIGKKLAAFETPDDFNNALAKLLNSFNHFTQEKIIEKANKAGTEIISTTDNKIILKIDSFSQSKDLGSSSWCISRYDHYFESYSKRGHQYFIYDLNKNSIDISSMIGMTLGVDGSYKACHLKNDNNFKESDAKELQIFIIKNDIKNYPELEKSLALSIRHTSKNNKLKQDL